jgi:hypothetical protein
MGKNQSASNLTNIIKQDASGNIVFTSGSTTLATISTAGQLSGSTAVLSAQTASFVQNAQSASYVLTAQTASFVANAQTASFVVLAQSASNAVAAATASFANAFTVAGTLTAQTLVVQTITSSVDFVTGSTRFGSLAINTHQFTGSVSVTGSLNATTFSGSGANLTSIPNAALSNSTISGIALGSNLATLTIGTGLSGTSYNGSGAVTIANTITNNNQLTNGAGYITTAALTNYVTLDGTQTITGLKTINNNLLFADSGTTKRGIQGTCGTNDMWFVGGGATATNAGFLEISTGDDGQTVGSCEPIYVRQYGPGDPLTGTLVRTAALLDASGNTSFPGSLTASGDVTAYSDARVKTNIKPIDSSLEKVLKLTGVTYNRTDLEDKSTKIGFIAQEVEKVLPEVVTYNEEADKYGVSYGNVTALLVEAIKEQQTQIEELKTIINALTK